MVFTPEDIKSRLDRILHKVQKPARYIGGEYNQIVKEWNDIPNRVALVFPDIYDIGMSNLGLMILYDIINRRKDALAERIYLPWVDMEAEMRLQGIPLYSLETKHPLSDFNIIGFSLPYETLYTNTLNALDLAGIPLFSRERTNEHPLIIAGGHSTFNPEPMHAFIDAFIIGEGEDVINEVVDIYHTWKKTNKSRDKLLKYLAKQWGVYVPSLYEVSYHHDGTIMQISKLSEDAQLPVQKRIVPRLPPPPIKFIVPYIEITHNRIPIEIMRGCTRGCRFCQAGMITRPVRERHVDEIVEAITSAIENTGFEEIGLLSLSSSDYTHILELVRRISDEFVSKHLEISLPSLRIESFSIDLLELLINHRKGGFTLAPEAATERMRAIINKPVSTQQILETTREIYARGWTTIKLYFMIGHPSETLDDVLEIAHLCNRILSEGRRSIGRRARLNVGISTFIPKPHTPFQWVPCDSVDQIKKKQSLLKQKLYDRDIKLTWVNPEVTLLEAWLSRGDRHMAKVIHRAWQLGAKFDAWQDQFRISAWHQAFLDVGLDPSFYTHRQRPLDEIFPWEHINVSVRKKFLTEDFLWSLEGRTRVDCRQRCFACGILPEFAEFRRENPGDVWQCPEVKNHRVNLHQDPNPEQSVPKPLSQTLIVL